MEYARDSRTNETHSLANPHRIYYLDANDCAETEDAHNGTYPLNKEAVWQIPIPEDHVAHVLFANVSLEQPQGGNCINDFVSVYNDSGTPEKFCSSLDLVIMKFNHVGLEQLTIKFQSDEANNEGGFSGAVWVYHKNSTWCLLYTILQ